MEDRAVAQTTHTSSEAGQTKTGGTGPTGPSLTRSGNPKGEETNPSWAGTGRARNTPSKFWLPRQNLGSSSLTGKFEEPYNFVTEAKNIGCSELRESDVEDGGARIFSSC